MIKVQSTVNANPAKDFNDFANNLKNENTFKSFNQPGGNTSGSYLQNNLCRLRPGKQLILDPTPRLEGNCEEWAGLDFTQQRGNPADRLASRQDNTPQP